MVANSPFSNEKNIPLCRFGPGGDFVSDWPMEPLSQEQIGIGPIGKTLSKLAEIIGAVIAPELIGQIKEANILQVNNLKENIESAHCTSGDNHAETTSNAKANQTVSAEPILFGDDTGISSPVRRKPNNRVRTRRSVKRKSVAASRPWQGTLFETYGPSTQVA